MLALLQRLVFEIGTGRATENARRERQDIELVHARIEAIGRRLAVVQAPQSDTAAA